MHQPAREENRKKAVDHEGYDADNDEQDKLLLKFKKRFKEKLNQAAGSRISHDDVAPHFRRLDSLARLLEGNAKCAAIYYHEPKNILWIANNKIYDNSRNKNQCLENLEYTFYLISQEDLNIEDIFNKLTQIIYINFKNEDWRKMDKFKDDKELKERIKKHLKNLFESSLTTKEWQQREIKNLKRSPLDNVKLSIIEKVVKLTRDFLKIRAFLLSTKNKNDIAGSILLAIKNSNYKPLRYEDNKVHAEMRILSKIYSASTATGYFYIGISKLCCAHCARAIEAFNNNRASDETIKCRGLHGQVYNWHVPNFISSSPVYLKTFVGKRSYKAYEKMKEEGKKEAMQFIASKESCPIKKATKSNPRPMYADSSESDMEFGFNCDEEFSSQIESMPLANIWTIRHIKMCHEDEFYILIKIELSIRKILALYKTKSKFFDLATEKVYGICKELAEDPLAFDTPIDIFEKLCGIYDKDISFFNEIITDKGKGAYDHGLDRLWAKYQNLGNYKAAVQFFVNDGAFDQSSNSNDSRNYGDDKDSQSSELCFEPDEGNYHSRFTP